MRVDDPASAPITTRILAVDDLEGNLIALQAALADGNYELVCVRSGSEAIAAAKKEEFALILLDVQMPKMDGFETAKQIRSHSMSSSTPIIFLTAIYRDEQYVEKGYFEGAVDYLYKPLSINILRSKVAIFAELFRKTKEIERQAEREKVLALREQEIRFFKKAIDDRDEFLSITSHELKTPLTPLLLQVQRFGELFDTGEIDRVPRSKVLRMWVLAVTQVRRLSRLVDDLLDLTRINEGRLRLRPGRFNLASLVRTVLEGFENEIAKSGCPLEVELSDVEGIWDVYRLEQVLVNLLVNALRYAKGKKIRITLRCERSQAVLMFCDEGIGISERDQGRIFSRFERAVPSENYGGLGLGLYISKNIIDAHRGELSVQSELGKGATFTVKLPINSEA